MAATSKVPRFLPQALDVVEQALRNARAMELKVEPSYTRMSLPHPDSPFLTLSESLARGLPENVIKLLLLPRENEASGVRAWTGLLEKDTQRLADEIEKRCVLPQRIQVLALPVIPGRAQAARSMAVLSGVRTEDVLDGPNATDTVSFNYVVRPFIPWPPLGEANLTPGERTKYWEKHCATWKIPRRLMSDERWQQQFFRGALFGGTGGSAAADDGGNLFLVSYWRWHRKDV